MSCDNFPTSEDMQRLKANSDFETEFVESPAFTAQTPEGQTKLTISGIANKSGGQNKGNYLDDPLLEDNIDYAYFVATQTKYKIADGITAPYQVDSATYPDPESDPNLTAFDYVTTSSLPSLTDIVYKSSGGNSAIENMISGVPIAAGIGDICSAGGQWRRVSISSPAVISDFEAITPINIEGFGAVGDARLLDKTLNPSPTDNNSAIQTAFIWVMENQGALTASPELAYYTSGTLLLPTFYNRQDGGGQLPDGAAWQSIVIDMQGAEFIGEGFNTVGSRFIESAFINSQGNPESSIGSPDEAYLFSGVRIRNMKLQNFEYGFRIQGFVMGCEVSDVMCNDVACNLYTERCFYTNFNQIITRGDTTSSDLPKFWLRDNSNIMPLKSCTVGGCKVGYLLEGAFEAMRFVDCGVESCTEAGVLTNGQFNLKFESCYFEFVGVGYSVESGGGAPSHITFDNCWGFGNFPMIGNSSTQNIGVRIENNNVLGGGCRWYDTLNPYSLFDIDQANTQITGNQIIDKFDIDGAPAIHVDQNVTVHQGVGTLADIVGHVKQTGDFHQRMVNGRMGVGFAGLSAAVGFSVTQTPESGGFQQVVYSTGITYTDTQNLYVALKVAHNTGTYTWYGNIYGDTAVTALETGGSRGGPTVTVDGNGYVVLTSPNLPSGGTLGVSAGEIRII